MISLARIRSELNVSPSAEARAAWVIDEITKAFEAATGRFWKSRSSYSRQIDVRPCAPAIWIKHRLVDPSALVISEMDIGETATSVASTQYLMRIPETPAGAYRLERIDGYRWKRLVTWTADIGYPVDGLPSDIERAIVDAAKFWLSRLEGDRLVQRSVSVGESMTSFEPAEMPKKFRETVDRYRYLSAGVE